VYDNEFRIIILLFGFLILIYIFFISRNNRKYKVYKTKNYDVKKTIDITANSQPHVEFKNIDMSLLNSSKSAFKILVCLTLVVKSFNKIKSEFFFISESTSL